MLRNIRIGTRLGIGIFIIILLTASVTLVAINRIGLLTEQTVLIHEHPFTVQNAISAIVTNIIKIHRNMKDVVLTKDPAALNEILLGIDELEKEVLNNFAIINERFLGENATYKNALEVYTSWEPIRNEVVILVREDKVAEAVSITKGKGAQHVIKIETAMFELENFAQGKAQEFLEKAESVGNFAHTTLYLLFSISLILGAVIAYILTRSIAMPIKKLRDITKEIGKGKFDLKIRSDGHDEIGQLAGDFSTMVKSLKETTTSRDNLKESEERFQRLTNTAQEGIVLSRDGSIIDVNTAFCDMFGYSCEETIGKSEIEFVAPEYFETVKQKISQYDETPYEIHGVRKNGSQFPCEILGRSILIKESPGRVTILRDITQRKKYEDDLKHAKEKAEESREKLNKTNLELDDLNKTLEEQVKEETEKNMRNEALLMQESKMAAMGEMISAISHQWRQPLNGLGLTIQEIKDDYECDELNKESIDRIVTNSMNQIQFMSKTIDDFRNFFKPSKQKENFDVEEAISSTIALISAQLARDDIAIKTEFQKGKDLSLLGCPNEFKQAVLNLLRNAIDATKEAYDDGTIERDKGLIVVRSDSLDEKITIDVENIGKQIDKEILSRIFEPYFTTKEEGKGTGIGLYMTQMIIENMGGNLSVENVSNGVCFRIKF